METNKNQERSPRAISFMMDGRVLDLLDQISEKERRSRTAEVHTLIEEEAERRGLEPRSSVPAQPVDGKAEHAVTGN